MKINERFLPYCDNEYANREDNSFNCEDVLDVFAISFIGWYENLQTDNQYETKQLLEMYKKEFELKPNF